MSVPPPPMPRRRRSTSMSCSSYARALIGAPSENPGGTEDAAASVAADILASLGATPEIIRSDEGRPSVVARFGDLDRPSLAWNGHLDTVPAGSADTWTSPPFARRDPMTGS